MINTNLKGTTMVIIRIILLLSFINNLQAMETLYSWVTGTIPNAQEYAQNCIQSQNYPILSSIQADQPCSLREHSIQPGQLMTELGTQSDSPSLVLETQDGKKRVKCSIINFKMYHYHNGIDYFTRYPLWFIGGYAVSYFLPAVLMTPVLTAGALVGLGYTYWKNQQKIQALEKSWNGVKKLSGITSTLGEALTSSRTKLPPQFLPNGHLHYQGYIPNGVLPGQSLYVDLEVKPLSEL